MNYVLDNIDMTFSILFLTECVLKIIINGLILNGKDSYLLNIWNVIDFAIVLLSIISLISSEQLKLMKSLRLFRILRPLKVILKNEELKIAV